MTTLLAAAAVAVDAAALCAALAVAVTPIAEQSLSDWATELTIPAETGTSRSGRLSWEGFEYLIEPLDGLHPDDPERDEVFLGSAQIAKTTVGVVATLYYTVKVPRPWGVALPSTDEVGKYNSTKWQPIVDATPALKRAVKPVSSRDERGSTATRKRFAGGYGLFFGAGSPKALQMITLCLVIYEETPNWERDVGGRGDPRQQIRARQLMWEMAGAKTFHNSTPGVVTPNEDDAGGPIRWTGCPITEDFEAGDQRRLYHPCPHCGDDADGVHLRLDYEQMQGLSVGETPHWVCPGCGGVIEHRHKAEMVRRCVWLPTFPSADPANPAPAWAIPTADVERFRYRPREGRHRSRHAWQAVSPAVDWHYIAARHRTAEAGDEAAKIVFSQQVRGVAYRLTMAKTDIQALLDKRDGRQVRGVVPAGFELVTCAVDLNGDWAQWAAYAWGPGGAHVVVDKGRIEGSPQDAALWAEMRELFARRFKHAEGGECPIELGGVDSGYGTVHVYAFARGYVHVYALDGADGWSTLPLRIAPAQSLRTEDGTLIRCRPHRVGTWPLKRELLNDAIPLSLNFEAGERRAGKPIWPGWLERDFFEELTAEALVPKVDKKTGVKVADAWVKVRRRNEEMDLWVYNAALAKSRGVGVQGAEPDWLELARRRGQGQLKLDDLWSRPTAPGPVAEKSDDDGWFSWKT